MGVLRLSYLGFAFFDQPCQCLYLCFLIDLPSIITALYCDFLSVIGMKDSAISNSIVLFAQTLHISSHLFFVQSIITFFVFLQPVFNRLSVYSLCAVIKIIGDHYICQLIDLLTVFHQHFIILINRRLLIAAAFFQIYSHFSGKHSIQDYLAGLFRIQGCSLYLWNNYKFIIFLCNICIRRLRTVLRLHTFQSGNCRFFLLFIILD